MNNAKVIIADVTATNGVVHVIDKVLVPPSLIKAEIERLRQQLSDLRELRGNQHGQYND